MKHSPLRASALTLFVVFIQFQFLSAQNTATSFHPDDSIQQNQTMSLDVKDTEITDVIRMISKGYGLNIILDREINGKVTLHLTDAPIIEGLNTLAESNGWELIKEGSVYRIRIPTAQTKSSIVYRAGKLTLDVQNINVVEFIKEISSKTAVSIVQDSKITGTVSGKLYQVPLEDGIKAILEGNGFKVTKRRNIFRVSLVGTSTSGNTRRRMSTRRSSNSSEGGIKEIEFSEGNLTINVVNGNLEEVINTIADESENEIIIYGRLSGEVNAKLNSVPLTEGLALLLGGTKFTFVQKDNVILIGDRNTATPSGQTLSKSELIHLRHIKADEVTKILPKNVPANNIKIVKEQNALLVSGTSEDIVKTREFLKTIDIPTPQVIIEALVVEYKRNIDKDFNFKFAGNMVAGDEANSGRGDYWSFPNLEFNRDGNKAKDFLKNFGFSNALIDKLPTDFYFTLRMLEQEQKAKVLAHPSITVLNGNKAKIDVGETQYFKVIGGTEQNPTENFRPINFGITLNITPWISKSGQITAQINPEISNSIGINEQGYPDVSRRSITTTVRIDDGKTLILGGLLKTEQKVNHSKVPILGDIPIIGYLFKSTKKLRSQSNLVIYITPRIIKKEENVDLEEEMKKFDLNSKKGIFERDQFDGIDLIGTGAHGRSKSVEDVKKISDTTIDNEKNNEFDPHDSFDVLSGEGVGVKTDTISAIKEKKSKRKRIRRLRRQPKPEIPPEE